jgi:hypothetical protein
LRHKQQHLNTQSFRWLGHAIFLYSPLYLKRP